MKMAVWTALILCKQKAVILILCRNEEMDGINATLENFEEKFNSKFEYPYVFLNDKKFTQEFQDKLSQTCKDRAKFGRVDADVWNMPPGIDRERAKKSWADMRSAGVPYADMESYHNMCRFFSKSFYSHPLVQEYKFYWRIEPNVRFRCEIENDPFDFMAENNKKYGFVITIREFMGSIKTLMNTTAKFLMAYYDKLPKADLMQFMFDGGEYNGCHFWSNFEIGAFDWLRSKAYNDFMDALERAGGFYYERWGDAPVHSIAASFLLGRSEVHFFEEIGYTHDTFTHCPKDGKGCDCKPSESVDFTAFSCLSKYLSDARQ